MRLFIAIALVCIGSSAVTAQENTATAAGKLGWLVGKWEKQNTRPGSEGYEVWKWHDGGYLTGRGYSIKQGDTVFVEKLSIVEKEGNLYYVAEVSHNDAPTYFRITEVSGDSFTSENPGHDFPKRIVYTLVGEELTATISDDEKVIPFTFRRIE